MSSSRSVPDQSNTSLVGKVAGGAGINTGHPFKERSIQPGAPGLERAHEAHRNAGAVARSSVGGSEANGKVNSTVASFSLIGQYPPKLTDALFLAERVHAALVQLSDGSSTFTGCDVLGKPLMDNAHAFILCESGPCLDGGQSGDIAHIAVHVPAGFGPGDLKALDSLKVVWGAGLHVQLVLNGIGQPEDFGGFDVLKGESPIMARSRRWESLTPFIPTRYPKATRAGVPKLDSGGLQIGSPEHDLRRLLRLAGLPDPLAVEPVSWTKLGGKKVSWQRFHTKRSFGDGRRAGKAGYGFRIEFPEMVRGPVAVGYGAHFGMGMFIAEISDKVKNSTDR